MLSTCGCNLKYGLGACLLSAIVAATICAFTDRVVANNAVAVTASVDRTNKGDRLVMAQRAERNFTSTKKTVVPKRSPTGCEASFSPFADPGRPDVLNYCLT